MWGTATASIARCSITAQSIDQNCDDHDVCDADGDGYPDNVDCDDNDPNVGRFECQTGTPTGPLE